MSHSFDCVREQCPDVGVLRVLVLLPSLMRTVGPFFPDAVPRALGHYPVVVLPLAEQFRRREEERDVHAIL